ncbi:MAG: BatA domain-containing protein [Phaeodactylibacter sp.]|nr:BatA domain-containing protein [Phaeodactylibacter sp.]MCB9274290.1 BatA domain-containing protein [Lewinellaceae bacterium]
MQFLFPTFLFALAALAIPVIIHLFYFRRFKKVYFTNVRFLKEVKEETSARSKLRNLLVLLMRLGAVAFLVLAFAQPFIPAKDAEIKKGNKAVSIFIDNSFSMEALSQDVPLIDKAKQRARETVEAFAPDDEFQILTNDFEGRHQRLVGHDDALALIEEVKISPAVRNLSQVLAHQEQALNTATTPNHLAYIISDFQRNITDIANYADSTIELNLIPLQAVQERNISVDSAWFIAPVPMAGQPNPIVVKVHNLTGEDAENIRLTIRYDGEAKPVGTLSIPAGASVLDTANLSIQRTGWHEAELAITDYPVQFDDKYYIAFNVKDEVEVLAINEAQPNQFLASAFAGMSNFRLTNLPSQGLDYSQLSNYEFIITNELTNISSGLAFELRQYVENGGNLLCFPSRNANIDSYRSFLSGFPANELARFEEQAREVGNVNTEEFVFNDVFENKSANLRLPGTTGNFLLTTYGNRQEEHLLTYRDGSTYLAKYKVGDGQLYLCAAPLDEAYNGLVRNGEIFIPMLYKMAISAGQSQRIAYTIGRDEAIIAKHQATSTEMVYKLKGQDEEFIPEQRIIGSKAFLSVNNQVREAGYYNLFLHEDKPLGDYAFNYDRKESALDYYSPDALADYTGPLANVIKVADNALLTAQIEEQSQGVSLWRWCIFLVLLFLAGEALLLRFWRV